MKRVFTTFMCALIGGTMFGQWTPAKSDMKKRAGDMQPTRIETYFKLDLDQLRSQLKGAQEMGANSKPIVVAIPTLDGKIQKFNVYSFPVVVKELADQYELGSYIGTSIEDPTQSIRFSVAPTDFQSMLFKDGNYEFIEPVNKSTGLYSVHPKTRKSGGKAFECSTTEDSNGVKDIENLYNSAKTFADTPGVFNRSSDRKYRTMRLVVSTTAEYTQKFGGTVAGALTQINATLSRVNGVFEKDFGLHLNLQNYTNVIYLNASTDPYSVPSIGTAAANASNANGWNVQLQRTLSTNVGNDNYDIGHLFGDSGGGGNAGCIGCVCINPTGDPATSLSKQKGSGFTSPANGVPSGDSFDIDYVAHEMGHQLGANHTFSHAIETSNVNVEPGSGTTIMGYAGITGALTDVQAHSDPYFHRVSIGQVQTNLIAKTCDVETSVSNNQPAISDLPSYTIPKKTAFVLTANVTDPENDPMTYTWEEVDSPVYAGTSSITINKNNIGTTTVGGSFRSVLPSTSPTRYFPKFSSVLAGVLDNSLGTWESTSQVARSSNFAITARDNNANILEQQTNSAQQSITVGNDGPFQITQPYLFTNVASNLTWDIANTTGAPYNVANVKIDYSTDNGVTWAILSPSTPNDGSESFTMPTSLNGQTIVMRISSIGNVFYALKKIYVDSQVVCGGTPAGTVVSNITISGGLVSWAPVSGATSYAIQYKKSTDATWSQATSATNSYAISNLTDCTSYQVQVAAVCSGSTGTYSTPITFSTTCVSYCAASSNDSTYLSISNLQVSNTNINNPSGPSTYTDFTGNTALQGNLVKGTSYSVTITATLPAENFAMVFIDYNKDGVFASNERVLNFPVTATNVFTGSFTVPTTGVVEGQVLRMRVMVGYAGADNLGLGAPASWVCGTGFNDGEVEDYNVVVTSSLATSETSVKNNGIQIYPNPATDILNITKVSDRATYKIYSAPGQLIDSGNINNGKINVSALVKGGYVITIDDKGIEQFKSKFIKK
jgi:hypothetical protein